MAVIKNEFRTMCHQEWAADEAGRLRLLLASLQRVTRRTLRAKQLV